MGLLTGKLLGHHKYQHSFLTGLLIPKGPGTSVNEYNGVGVDHWYRARSHYHGKRNPWIFLGLFFALRILFDSRECFRYVTKHMRREKHGHRDIAAEKVDAGPEENTRLMKEYAMAHPEVDAVGVTRMTDEYRYEGIEEGNQYPWIIVVARAMKYDEIAKNLEGDFSRVLTQVIGGYERSQKAAVDVSNWIRERGFYARGYGGLTKRSTEFHLTIPPAIAAGIGQLGKNGSMISDKMGSAFRLATILTDMEFVADKPREIGVEEFCVSCKKCTEDCPPGALNDEKVMVRGTRKWYVDFEKCMPYLAEHKACGICLTTCPWSRPGIAPSLSQKMLKKMARRADAATS